MSVGRIRRLGRAGTLNPALRSSCRPILTMAKIMTTPPNRDDDQISLPPHTLSEKGAYCLTDNRRDFLLLHDAWLTWTHEWRMDHRHSSILVVDQLPPADLYVAARAIHDRVSDPATSLRNALYHWVRNGEWRTVSR